jgi:DNA-binding MarR family transcriptional regulator
LTRKELEETINLEVRRSQNRTDEYDEAVSTALRINRTDMRCVDVLDQEGRLTAGRLAALTGLTTGAITTVLDRLERAGFARRVRDEHDRRRVYVELTDEARARSWEFYEPMAELAATLYSRFTDEQLEVVLDFLEQAGELADAALAKLRERLQQAPEE